MVVGLVLLPIGPGASVMLLGASVMLLGLMPLPIGPGASVMLRGLMLLPIGPGAPGDGMDGMGGGTTN